MPKIPKRQTGQPIQIQSAEILESSEDIPEVLQVDQVLPELLTKIDPETTVALPLSIESLKQAFSEFASKQKLSLVALIKLLEPSLNGNEIIIKMSKQQEELIGETKIEWQAYIRQYFKHNQLQLLFQIDESQELTAMAYTPSEQYTELANESDAFRDLVNQFKLKIKHS